MQNVQRVINTDVIDAYLSANDDEAQAMPTLADIEAETKALVKANADAEKLMDALSAHGKAQAHANKLADVLARATGAGGYEIDEAAVQAATKPVGPSRVVKLVSVAAIVMLVVSGLVGAYL